MLSLAITSQELISYSTQLLGSLANLCFQQRQFLLPLFNHALQLIRDTLYLQVSMVGHWKIRLDAHYIYHYFHNLKMSFGVEASLSPPFAVF